MTNDNVHLQNPVTNKPYNTDPPPASGCCSCCWQVIYNIFKPDPPQTAKNSSSEASSDSPSFQAKMNKGLEDGNEIFKGKMSSSESTSVPFSFIPKLNNGMAERN
ncbi:unnamed protein product, partial [Rodentolepis nana]